MRRSAFKDRLTSAGSLPPVPRSWPDHSVTSGFAPESAESIGQLGRRGNRAGGAACFWFRCVRACEGLAGNIIDCVNWYDLIPPRAEVLRFKLATALKWNLKWD